MNRRSGQLMKYTAVGAFIISVFIASMLLYISYIGDLERTTSIKSEAAQDRLGIIEEIMNARCATEGRAIFNLTAIEQGDISCINSSRSMGISFQVGVDGSIAVHNYSIDRSGVTALAAGEPIRIGTEDIRTFPAVYREQDGTAHLGHIELAVTGTGWQCRSTAGQCIPEDQVCARPVEADCGPGRICCRRLPQRGVGR